MCCSVSPGVRVQFSDTVLYAAALRNDQGETVHVLGYQNKARNGVRRGSAWSAVADSVSFGATGNAMILPFPTVPATMTDANVLDTKHCRDLLQDMAEAVAPRALAARAPSGPNAPRSQPEPPKVQVFKAAGIYTVVLAQDPRDIPDALGRVPRTRRPALNPALFEAYAEWYPGWTIALCCFNNRRARLANPLLWWYKPKDSDHLFLPALDCHSGDVPDLNAQVELDHVLAVGSDRMTAAASSGRPGAARLPVRRVHYRDPIPPPVAPYVLPALIGRRFDRPLPNGDFVCRLEDVDAARFAPPACGPGQWRSADPIPSRLALGWRVRLDRG